ncbi:MAG: glucose-1-phosphate adenylyltransferase [Candidatus Marinimicrobia bacterium]|nr:glucose-1-phosphate adenylyltransferase [Candidatus Neomarinimicrobiota bacterium]
MKSNGILAVILGGGKGTRLYPLTKYRAKPAVPIAGKFRIIDIAISNCLNSDIKKIFILTQFNTHSLHRHIYDTYRFGRLSRGFVEILAAQQTSENMNWYQGTADAVRQNISFITDVDADYTLVLSGDHLYRMDYREFLKTHIEKKADITISVKPVSREEASSFGILQTDRKGRILRFIEKPDNDVLASVMSPGLPDKKPFLASMGIYMFATEFLFKVLEEDPSDDFGKHIIPSAIESYKVYAHRFEGYWKDIGTIEAFFEANLELASINPPFTFYDEDAPVYTRPRFLPGSRMEDCQINRALLGEGCYVRKSVISNAIIGIRTIIGCYANIENCVIMGADYYESIPPEGLIPIGIGNNCVVKNAIIDKNARIGNGVQIVNKKGVKEIETKRYSIRDGIIVIPKNVVIENGFII